MKILIMIYILSTTFCFAEDKSFHFNDGIDVDSSVENGINGETLGDGHVSIFVKEPETEEQEDIVETLEDIVAMIKGNPDICFSISCEVAPGDGENGDFQCIGDISFSITDCSQRSTKFPSDATLESPEILFLD